MASQPSIDDVLGLVDTWFQERIQKYPISHDVLSYNQAFKAKEDLKDRLSALIAGKPAAEPAAAEDPAPAPDPAPKEARKPNSKSKPAA